MASLKQLKTKKESDQSLYSLYLKEIHKIPMLSRQEERELAHKAMQSCEVSRNKLIRANLRFVVSVVSKYKANNLSNMDLINEGNMGLIRAAERFNPHKGYHFISYAVWWIKQAILYAIQQKSHPIRLPLNKKADLRRLYYAKSILANQENDIQSSIEEIASMTQMKPLDALHLLQISKDQISLDAPIANTENASLIESIQDTNILNVDEYSTLNDLKTELNNQMDILTPQEKTIIDLRFGLTQATTQSLQKIGNQMKLSKERIRQIEKKALSKIRNHKKSAHLQAYLNY